ncbi:MAG: universal stress protein [Longimicrobiales bacterium]|nr:universal stress protein [Longimicrobiales bacterium]
MSVPRMERILAGVDLPPADREDPVLSAAVRLAQILPAELHLVHAVEAGPMEPPLLPTVTQRLEEARTAVSGYLDRVLPDDLPGVVRHVELGRAHRVLAERAREVGADLLVLGPHRGFGPSGPLKGLGTTTDRLVRTLDVPVWVVREALELPVRRLLVPVDFEPCAEAAVDVAVELAHLLGPGRDEAGAAPAEIELLHVAWPAELEADPEMAERELLPRLERQGAGAAERTGVTEGVSFRAHVVGATDIARGVLERAAETPTGVVVLGTHGRGALGRALLGSVAAVVAREAPCSVVLVPPGEEQGLGL